MSLLLQDGAITGHFTWCEQALSSGVADGVVISPFFTPDTPRRGQTTGGGAASRIRGAGGQVMFDATTHALQLPGVDNWTSYNTWDLWDGARGDLSTDALRVSHIDRVFGHQDALGAPRLVPTVALDDPNGADADTALGLATSGQATDASAWQSLGGRRGLWLSDDLDAYVGALAQLRAPVWFLTVVRERPEYPPDMTEAVLTAAVCRTVHSLAQRSRVVLCHADLYGLPSVAAGADTVGTGWHGKQRVCAPGTFQRNDPSAIRRQATWHTYRGLYARLHGEESNALFRADAALGAKLHAGPLTTNSVATREHHLEVVRSLTQAVNGAGPTPRDRVAALRLAYEAAQADFEALRARLGRTFGQRRAEQVDGCFDGLRIYAEAESIW